MSAVHLAPHFWGRWQLARRRKRICLHPLWRTLLGPSAGTEVSQRARVCGLGPCLPQCVNERPSCARPRPSLAAYVGPRADGWLLSDLDAPGVPGFTSCSRKPPPPRVRFSPSSAVRGPLSFLSSTRVWGGSARKLPHGPRTGALARTACGSVVRLPPLAHRGQLPALIQAGPGLFLRDAPEAGLAYRQSSPLSVPCVTTRLSRFKYKGRRLTL